MSYAITISPEYMHVAETYLSTMSIDKTAQRLSMTPREVTEMIAVPEVKRFIDKVFFDQGYNNRFKLRSLLDKLIEAKIAEAMETEVYTTKDLAELIALSHKMTMDHEKAAMPNVPNTAVQNNFYGDNYGKLLSKLVD
jgi:hypothetical protein